MSRIRMFNEWLAAKATEGFGTMWAFYLLACYGLLPLLFPSKINTLLYWSNVIQLVALPLIMVGTYVLGRSAAAQAVETHDAVMEELADVRELVAALHARTGAS